MSVKTPYLTLTGAGVGFLACLVVNFVAAPGSARSAAESYGSPPGPTSVAPTPAGSVSAPPATPSTSPSASTTPTPTPTESTKASPAFPPKVVYAGHAKRNGPAVAVAILGDHSAAYLCDGRRIEAWLKGSARTGQVRLTGKHGAKLSAKLKGSMLVGTVTVSHKDYAFSIKPAKRPAGLYRSKTSTGGKSTTIGWIVLPDGTQVGVRNVDGTLSAAPRISTDGDVTLDGKRVAPTPIQGNETL